MSNEQPLVTVYIPTFNRLDLLKRAVQSVQNQTYHNLEIIIVDDCSSDGTQAYLECLAKEDHRVRYFFKEKNSGACVSRNIAIENAAGEFITGLDDDDYFLSGRIEYFINEWIDDVSCLFSINVFKKSTGKFVENDKFLKEYVYQQDLLKNNYIGNQVFTKTNYLKKINGFDPKLRVWQDLECWYRLLGIACGKKIDSKSYIVDISHLHERITNQGPKKVMEAFDYFRLKHDLNNDQLQDLETHLISYRNTNLHTKVYIRKFRNLKSFNNFIKIFISFFNLNKLMVK